MTAEEIAGLALFVSACAFIHTWYTAKQNSNLTKASIKSNLLTQMFEQKLHDEDKVEKIENLIRLCEKKSPDHIDGLNKMLADAKGYLEYTHSSYDQIKDSKYITSEEFEKLRHECERSLRRSVVVAKKIENMTDLLNNMKD